MDHAGRMCGAQRIDDLQEVLERAFRIEARLNGGLSRFDPRLVGCAAKLATRPPSRFLNAMAVSFGKGCPKTRTILTYSQSTDSSSKYFADQTRMFSNKRWVKLPYCERSIRRATLRTTRLR